MSNGENKLYSCFNKYKEIRNDINSNFTKNQSCFLHKSRNRFDRGGVSLDSTIKAKARSVNGINADANGNINILDLVHPIGSLYWSKNSTDPSVLFGGTWKRIKDTFILACGDTYSIDSTGGEASHALTVNEMPTHNHSASTDTQGDHTHGAWTDTQGNHYHSLPKRTWGWGDPNATESVQASTITGYWGNNALCSSPGDSGTRWSGSHAHNVGMNSEGSHAHTVTVNNNGAGAAHNNMPPYITYYCWERTA